MSSFMNLTIKSLGLKTTITFSPFFYQRSNQNVEFNHLRLSYFVSPFFAYSVKRSQIFKKSSFNHFLNSPLLFSSDISLCNNQRIFTNDTISQITNNCIIDEKLTLKQCTFISIHLESPLAENANVDISNTHFAYIIGGASIYIFSQCNISILNCYCIGCSNFLFSEEHQHTLNMNSICFFITENLLSSNIKYELSQEDTIDLLNISSYSLIQYSLLEGTFNKGTFNHLQIASCTYSNKYLFSATFNTNAFNNCIFYNNTGSTGDDHYIFSRTRSNTFTNCYFLNNSPHTFVSCKRDSFIDSWTDGENICAAQIMQSFVPSPIYYIQNFPYIFKQNKEEFLFVA